MGFAPTPEQLEALRLFETGQSLAVEAGAGTGKTSTLQLLANSTKRRGQYIAFNRAIVMEAGQKFPQTVNCSTAHSLAFRAIGKDFINRLNNSQRVKPMELAAILGLRPLEVTTYTGDKRILGAGFLAGLALRGVTKFCQSADAEPTERHVPRVEGLDKPLHEQHGLSSYPVNDYVAKSLVATMKKAWLDLCRYDGALPFKHDHYLKMWQLSGPRIDADYILFDEAQDANPVLQAIVVAQDHAQLVWVGDSQQQIYGFTGAVNALASVPSDSRTFLTQSFRFGPAVAAVANEVLDMLNAELRIVGFDAIASSLGEIDEPDVLLTRTNAGAVRAMFEAQADGKKVHLVGGAAEITRFARAAQTLMEGARTDHPDLACFATWDEVVQYVEEDESGDLRLLVGLITEFGTEPILTALGDASQERHADLVISTAHKSKGREWNKVKLGNDFPSKEKVKDEELRLLYVAVTRAKLELDVTLVATLDEAVEAAHEKGLVHNGEYVAPKISQHVGTEGGTLDATLTVEEVKPIETKYGPTTLITLRDAEGNTFKWITKQPINEGDTLTATWNVKQHGEWRGVKETTVARPSGLTVEASV
jgi:UvrD-like helicase C-terminal domain/AAA domain